LAQLILVGQELARLKLRASAIHRQILNDFVDLKTQHIKKSSF
jgi:hypothetical protein